MVGVVNYTIVRQNNRHEDFEQEIANDVETFTSKLGCFSYHQILLLRLVTRRNEFLDNEKIKQAARDIAKNNKECSQLSEFLMGLKSKIIFKHFDYYLCILVMDEILDLMPWKMVLLSQELTCAHSIHLLFDLYDRYKNQIDEGYHKINANNGFTLINPNDDEKLSVMCNWLNEYYSDCLPKWECLENIIPSMEKLSECLAKNDLLVYSRHGSCLQFLPDFEFGNKNDK